MCDVIWESGGRINVQGDKDTTDQNEINGGERHYGQGE